MQSRESNEGILGNLLVSVKETSKKLTTVLKDEHNDNKEAFKI